MIMYFFTKRILSLVKSVKEHLQGWSWRGLTILGRIQVIKSFAIPNISYGAALSSYKKDFIQELNSLLLYRAGKDKVKRSSLINPIEKGGLSMPENLFIYRIYSIKRPTTNKRPPQISAHSLGKKS